MITARLLALLALGLLVSCGTPERPGAPVRETAAGAACHVDPNNGSALAERGIGGTGASSESRQPGETNQPTRSAERGIGGTGAVAERGIGGTGIIGVITGFASICVNGLEIDTSAGVPVLVDGIIASGAALRAGQLVAIEAGRSNGILHARRVLVRHEVSGPVGAAEPDGTLAVAGQRITVADRLWGQMPKSGDWIAVSGLRRPGGDILATRIDRRAPGRVTVHGRLDRGAGRLHIGRLPVRAPTPQAAALAGAFVTANGRLDHGILITDSITPDILVTNPAAAFGPGVERIVIEAYVEAIGKRLQLGAGLETAARSGLRGIPGWAIVELKRRGDDSLLATTVITTAPVAAAPVPTPNGEGRPEVGGKVTPPTGGAGTEGQPSGSPGPTQFGPAAATGLPGMGGPNPPGNVGPMQSIPGTMPGAGLPGMGGASPGFHGPRR